MCKIKHTTATMDLTMDMNMTMSAKDYFVFSKHIKHLLFENFDINSAAGIVGACLVIGVCTVLLEGTKALMLYLQLRLKQNPLTYGQTSTSIQSDRIQYHVSGYFLHTLNLIVGYLIMLAVMSYNLWVLLAVILGSGLGFYIFGAVNKWNQTKFSALSARVYERYDSRVALTDQQTEVVQ